MLVSITTKYSSVIKNDCRDGFFPVVFEELFNEEDFLRMVMNSCYCSFCIHFVEGEQKLLVFYYREIALLKGFMIE